MALNFSALTKPLNDQVVDPSTGLMREEWSRYFQTLTKQLNGAVGELGGAGVAPADAQFIVGAASAGLSAERVATNSTSNTWNLTTPEQAAVERAALTGDVTAGANSNATTIAAGVVSNAKLADMVQATVKGRAAGAGTGAPTDLSAAQLATLIGAMSGVNVQVITATDDYEPTPGMTYALVISTGGGGGGGGCDSDGTSNAAAAGGGAGGTCIELFAAAAIGASQTVTIGAGGTAGAVTGGTGGAGGNTTFGALHTAGGGPGGTGVAGTATETVTAGVAGGTATGGLINIPGGMGMPGIGGNDFTMSGAGGASFWGGGARGVASATSAATAGVAATAYGAGGSGACNANQTAGALGGGGMSGICMIIEFFA